MSAVLKPAVLKPNVDYVIADLSLAAWGRKELNIAQTAVLVETLQALGAQVRWAWARSRRLHRPTPLGRGLRDGFRHAGIAGQLSAPTLQTTEPNSRSR